MNKYQLHITDSDLLIFIKKNQDNILHSEDILDGPIIFASSSSEAREKACIKYPLLPIYDSEHLNRYSNALNAKYYNAWSSEKLASCTQFR